jgi:hypothetical protein
MQCENFANNLSRRYLPANVKKQTKMTGDESRNLTVGSRVCWGVTITDLGTVAEKSWSGVTIEWDDGHSASIQHNDMAQIQRVPTKV